MMLLVGAVNEAATALLFLDVHKCSVYVVSFLLKLSVEAHTQIYSLLFYSYGANQPFNFSLTCLTFGS